MTINQNYKENFAPAPPPYLDDDEMLQDYIDDDDFGGPPPPAATATATSTTVTSTSTPNFGYDDYDEDFLEEMMEIEGQQEKQTSTPVSRSTTTTMANETAATTTTDTPMNDNNKNAIANEVPTKNSINDVQMDGNSSNGTVEEYLAARQRDHNIYNFERYVCYVYEYV